MKPRSGPAAPPNGGSKLLKYGWNGILAFSTAPLKLATVLGLLSTAFSIIYFIVTLLRKATEHIAVDGFTQTVILIVFFGGMQLFTIGIIGEYLAKNYIETKRRPVYLAKEILDYKNNDETKENGQRIHFVRRRILLIYLTRQNIWQLAESSVDANYDYVLYLQYDKWEFL